MTQPCHHRQIPPPLRLPATLLAELGTFREVNYLGHGCSNHHWRLSGEKQDYIWRQFGPTPPGASRSNERLALSALQHFAWVPKLIHESAEGMLFLAEQALEFKPTELSHQQRQQLIETVTTLWQQPIALKQMDYPELITHYATLAGQVDKQPLQPLLQLAKRWDPHFFCVIHQDIHADNLLLTRHGCILIDWEYTVIGNPWIDAVALDRMLHLTHNEKKQLEHHLPFMEMQHPWQEMQQWLTRLDQLWYAAQMPKAVVE